MKRPATEVHHLFSQGTRNGWRRRLYGDLLDDPRNLQYLCYDCHHNKPLKKYTEREFCRIMDIEIRSKRG
jgi:hypothetical protein